MDVQSYHSKFPFESCKALGTRHKAFRHKSQAQEILYSRAGYKLDILTSYLVRLDIKHLS